LLPRTAAAVLHCLSRARMWLAGGTMPGCAGALALVPGLPTTVAGRQAGPDLPAKLM